MIGISLGHPKLVGCDMFYWKVSMGIRIPWYGPLWYLTKYHYEPTQLAKWFYLAIQNLTRHSVEEIPTIFHVS